MTLHGVDVYIWSPEVPDVPKSHGKFTLTMITNRGTKIWPPPAPDIAPSDWPRCRYVSDEVATADEIDALVGELTKLGFNWTKVQKLFRDGDTNLYSEAY